MSSARLVEGGAQSCVFGSEAFVLVLVLDGQRILQRKLPLRARIIHLQRRRVLTFLYLRLVLLYHPEQFFLG